MTRNNILPTSGALATGLIASIFVAASGNMFSGPMPTTETLVVVENHERDVFKIKFGRTAESEVNYEHHFRPSTTKAVRFELAKSIHILNAHLFNGELPPVVVTTDYSDKHTLGYFSPKRFVINAERVDQISINPLFILERSQEQVMATLVHEMTHHFVYRRTRENTVNGYHSKVFAEELAKRGLIASSTGKPGGKNTGQNMSHYPAPGGRFERVVAEMLNSDSPIRWRAAVNELRKNILISAMAGT